MVQNPKGGGLSSTIGGSQQMGGVQKTTDFLDKSTWALATMLIVLILMSSLSFTGAMGSSESKIINQTSGSTSIPAAAPIAPTPAAPATPVAPVEAPQN